MDNFTQVYDNAPLAHSHSHSLMSNSVRKISQNAETVPEATDIPIPFPPPLDFPDHREFSKKWRVRICACEGFSLSFFPSGYICLPTSQFVVTALLRYTIDFLSVPLYVWPVRNRIRTSIDTGPTGRCRLCIYYPVGNSEKKSENASRGVLVHLHGGGWSA